MGLFAFGALTVRNSGSQWHTRLDDQNIIDVFIPTVYYLIISAGGLHFVSLCISLYLGLMFRKIACMPPDMNPLEPTLTTRAKHKKNKSSVATASTDVSEKRFSTPLEDRRRSGVPYEDVSRPPTIPFLQTRGGSLESLRSRDSRLDLPSRQYQITPSYSPRSSATSAELKRMSRPRSAHLGSYTELPLGDTGSSRSSTGRTSNPPANAAQQRAGKFTETWNATESLISRTQARNRAMNAMTAGTQTRGSKSYQALSQRYGQQDMSGSESERDEDGLTGSDFENEKGSGVHPNPLRSHPPTPPRAKAPLYTRSSVLSEVSLNERKSSGSMDIADEKPPALGGRPWQRNRDSSIQPESAFYAKPYGELKAATPPIMVGSKRQVSSGNDYDTTYSSAYGRRSVSGKIAEEGRGGARGYSRYSVLNE
jgi:hypothetical protein